MSTESLLHHLARQLKRNIHSFSQAGLTARWRPLKQKKKSNYRCQRSACSFVLTELLENKILRAASALRKGSLFFAKLPVWLSLWSVWPLTLKKKKKTTHKNAQNIILWQTKHFWAVNYRTKPVELIWQAPKRLWLYRSSDIFWNFPRRKNKYSTPSIEVLF